MNVAAVKASGERPEIVPRARLYAICWPPEEVRRRLKPVTGVVE